MKTILLNGTEKTIDAATVSFDEFVNSLNTSLVNNRQVVSCVKVDGLEITEDDHKKLAQIPIEALGSIEILTSNPQDLALETMTTLEIYIDRIMQNIERTATNYKTKNYVAADAYFERTIDGMDLFVQTISGIKQALRIGANSKVTLTEATLVSIMNDLLEAKRQNNYVFLADLLEQELIENLREWKSIVFPIFRNWRAS